VTAQPPVPQRLVLWKARNKALGVDAGMTYGELSPE
jgi:hypothetical protein